MSRHPLAIAPGVALWPDYFEPLAQRSLIAEISSLERGAPFYRPEMPRSGKPISVEETNFGPLGWVSDKSGYRYQPTHPLSGLAWPAIPPTLLQLWFDVTSYSAEPQCCLVNRYRNGARMGLHQDRDEAALDAPVLSISLGDDAVFRIGTDKRRGPTNSVKLHSGDVIMFGGVARLAFHGIDRVIEGTSAIVPDGGRINLTLRRVTRPQMQKDARSGG